MGTAFEGQVVVVTGASSGIGRATAHAFAREGATVVLAARGRKSLQSAAEECRRIGARSRGEAAEAVAVPTDVSDEAQVRSLVDDVVARFGRIDVFVGNAGLFAYGLFEQIPLESFRRIVETNLFGHVHAVRALLPHFRERGRGTYILVGSIQSLLSAPYQSAYVTSKHAALGLMDVLADEFQGTPIRFGAVLPSTIDTPIYQNGANYTGKESHPLPPAIAPERVARAILASARRPKRNRYVGRLQALLVPLEFGAPALFHALTRPAVEILALRGRATPTDGNLEHSADEGNALSGGWRRRSRSRWIPAAAVVAASAAVGLRLAGSRRR